MPEFDPIETISPSKVESFAKCPLAFRYTYMMKIQGPSTVAQVQGSITHLALEYLHDEVEPGARDLPAALGCAQRAWDTYSAESPEFADIAADDLPKMRAQVDKLVEAYFSVEDPRQVEAVATESWIDAQITDNVRMRGIIDRTDPGPVLVDYKGLAADTPIPTLAGWKAMADLAVGDQVFGGDGTPCNVVGKGSPRNLRCFELGFDDSTTIVCDLEHRWAVEVLRGRAWTPETTDPEGLADLLAEGFRVRISNAALEIPAVDLPIDPYVFGAWIGDGKKSSGEVCKPLPALFAEIARRGFLSGKPQSGHSRTILGLRTLLRENGWLGSKEIPSTYLRASRFQRLELLRGIMDTDGHWNVKRNRAVLTTTSNRYAEQVAEIVRSLGWSCYRWEGKGRGFGEEVNVWQVWFSPDEPVFLARNEGAVSRSRRSGRRLVKSVKEVRSVKTQCITVDSPDSCYLAGQQMIRTHNSGKAPSPRFEKQAFQGLGLYAWMFAETYGELPRQVRLLYLANKTTLTMEPSAVSVRGSVSRARAVVRAIERAAEIDDFRPRKGPLCSWCPHQANCPEFGGSILPASARAAS